MAAMLLHHYGPSVHLFDDPFLATLLAGIGSPDTGTAELPVNFDGRIYDDFGDLVFSHKQELTPRRKGAKTPRKTNPYFPLCVFAPLR